MNLQELALADVDISVSVCLSHLFLSPFFPLYPQEVYFPALAARRSHVCTGAQAAWLVAVLSGPDDMCGPYFKEHSQAPGSLKELSGSHRE